MEKEVIVGEKKFVVKDIKYKDAIKFGQMSNEDAAKQMMLMSTEITEIEFENLSMKEGFEIQKVINELNGFADFREPLTSKQQQN
jgi:hypothetical protein